MTERLKVAVALAALIMVALPVGVAAQRAREDPPEGVLSPGPLGVPYARWAEQWYAAWPRRIPSGSTDCARGDGGDVFYVPSPDVECTVTSDQHLLVMIASIACDYQPARKERIDEVRRSLAYGCLMSGRDSLTDPFLAVDDEEIVLDGRFFVLTPVDSEAFAQGLLVTTYWT